MSKGRIDRSKERALDWKYLRSILHYDPETGFFSWILSRPGIRPANGRAGSVCGKDGRRDIQVDKARYYEHRLAWFWMTGEWPPHEIDHRDTNAANNRWSNLRLATRSQNGGNTKPHRGNRTGLKGVTNHGQNRKFYMARITVRGRAHNLGLYTCPAAAHFAYVVAADKLHGEFARVA